MAGSTGGVVAAAVEDAVVEDGAMTGALFADPYSDFFWNEKEVRK